MRIITQHEPSAIASHYSYTAVEHDGSGGLLMAFGYAHDTLGRITNIAETNSDGVTQVRSRLKHLACGCYNRTRRTTTVN